MNLLHIPQYSSPKLNAVFTHPIIAANFPRILSPFQSQSPLQFGKTTKSKLSTSSSMLLPVAKSTLATSSSSSDEQKVQKDFLTARAYWVSESIIAWNVDDVEHHNSYCYLYASQTAALFLSTSTTEKDVIIQDHDVKIKLEQNNDGLPPSVIEKFPHIKDYKSFSVPPISNVKTLLKCQLAIAAFTDDGKSKNVTGLQLAGVLDELYSYEGRLGASFSQTNVSLNLWAPTAQAVRVWIYSEPLGGDPLEIVDLVENANNNGGVWSIIGPKSWEGFYYVYEVCVYHHSTMKMENCFVNDPYARGLSSDAQRTLLVNLDSEYLKPQGWDNLVDEKPSILSPSDISIYELHIRDFSASDLTVQPDFRGCYLAFTSQESACVLHLKKLRNAGLTHVHLLPAFQFGGVEDDKDKWKFVDNQVLEKLPPDSDEQQAHIVEIQDEDGYNWGYNPVLWGVPKGSYASDPNGPCRIIEFRKMVQALNRTGLRVVLDVVYNHLHGSGPFDENSVLDKIVPGYYLRRNADGDIENSTCVNNTASEHFMVERLILDDLLCWAVDYKVDGFRFDLMGHIMKRTMVNDPTGTLFYSYVNNVKAKSVLQSLVKERNGIDGSDIYIYGEGWDFGEVANDGRGVNASQINLCGTGIGSFNDRIRDAMLGGSPFGHPLQQGYVTGLSLQPNGHDHGTKADVKNMLAVAMDHIQVGMAANLKDYVLTNCEGKEVKASECLTYGEAPVAYASCPTETINYVSAHDNETLFDIVSLKTPMEISIDERCRINHLASSIIALSQGIPFFHAGDEILRSKSIDRDSYNSGDWFNRLDYSYNSNNWGVGLPPKTKNENNWLLIKPRLGNLLFKPKKTHILAALENFMNLLKIRYSSPLFRLTTTNAIQERVRFLNSGTSAIPGVIVMSIEDGFEVGGVPADRLSQLDPIFSYIVVIVNASATEISYAHPMLCGRSFQLHPIQIMSSDDVVKKSTYKTSSGCFTVPPTTTSVFVQPRS